MGKLLVSWMLVIVTSLELTSSSVIQITPEEVVPEMDYLLPSSIIPNAYTVEVWPYITTPPEKAATFEGKVKISITVNETVDVIRLHADEELTIGVVTVNTAPVATAPLNVHNISRVAEKNFLDINMQEELAVGDYTLDIAFVGKINIDYEGLFQRKYTDSEGHERWYAATNFVPTHARRVFPCWDEPQWKAKFTLSVAHHFDYDVISNMHSQNTVIAPQLQNWLITTFTVSYKMSTYLVAFSVNQFSRVLNSVYNIPGVPEYSILVREGTEFEEQVNAISEIAPVLDKQLSWYFSYVNLLKKVDILALPDYNAPGSPSWGHNTFSENDVLYKAGTSNSKSLQNTKLMVAQGIAHTWFGNLVTARSWDLNWLNEGFATFFSYHALATVEETWQLERQLVLDETHAIMKLDSSPNSLPLVRSDVFTPEKIQQTFDAITHKKGASMVMFLAGLLGKDNFRTSMEVYIAGNVEQSVTMDALWDAMTPLLELPRGLSLSALMEGWTLQPGYPVINVTRHYDNQFVSVAQERFYTNGTRYDEITWTIPITWTREDAPNFIDHKVSVWLRSACDRFTAPKLAPDSWIIVNLQQIGYYRVNYDDKNWKNIINALRDEKRMQNIDVINRAQIMDDIFALARASYVSYDIALDASLYLKQELEYMPWISAFASLSYIRDRMNVNQQTRDVGMTYLMDLIDNIYLSVDGLGVSEDDSHILNLKRAIVLEWACRANHKSCNKESAELFATWIAYEEQNKTNPIVPDLRNVVYCSGIKQGSGKEFNFLMEQYESSSNVWEGRTILSALGCSTNTSLLQRYLMESIATNSRVRPNDEHYVFAAVYNNPLGVELALTFVLENWDKASETYANFEEHFYELAGKLNTEEHRKMLEDFEAANPSATMIVSKALTMLDETLAWHENHLDSVVTWLQNYNAPTTVGPNSASSIFTSALLLLVSLYVSLA